MNFDALPQLRGHWSGLVLGWFKSEERERRRKIALDRKHLEARSRRFLKNFLNADQTRKPHFYRAVEAATEQCYPADALLSPELNDAQIAEATSTAAMKVVIERSALVETSHTIAQQAFTRWTKRWSNWELLLFTFSTLRPRTSGRKRMKGRVHKTILRKLLLAIC